MSWLDNIIDFGKSVFTGNSLGGNILKTVLTGFALNKVQSSINPGNSAARETAPAPVDLGARLQASADSKTKIPVVYGTAVLGGKLTDIHQSADNQVMTYVLTICEQTGALMSSGAASQITFDNIYWNNQRLVFNSDGITANYSLDKNGKVDRSVGGLVKIYCYSGGSTHPVVPRNYTNGSLVNAWSVMPNWTTAHGMNDLVFAIVQVTYSREKNITGLGDVKFKLSNTLTMPGDCIYDQMTNTRYGAGIAEEEINAI